MCKRPIKLYFFDKTDFHLEKPYQLQRKLGIRPLTFSFPHPYKITILDKIILINSIVVRDIAKIITPISL